MLLMSSSVEFAAEKPMPLVDKIDNFLKTSTALSCDGNANFKKITINILRSKLTNGKINEEEAHQQFENIVTDKTNTSLPLQAEDARPSTPSLQPSAPLHPTGKKVTSIINNLSTRTEEPVASPLSHEPDRLNLFDNNTDSGQSHANILSTLQKEYGLSDAQCLEAMQYVQRQDMEGAIAFAHEIQNEIDAKKLREQTEASIQRSATATSSSPTIADALVSTNSNDDDASSPRLYSSNPATPIAQVQTTRSPLTPKVFTFEPLPSSANSTSTPGGDLIPSPVHRSISDEQALQSQSKTPLSPMARELSSELERRTDLLKKNTQGLAIPAAAPDSSSENGGEGSEGDEGDESDEGEGYEGDSEEESIPKSSNNPTQKILSSTTSKTQVTSTTTFDTADGIQAGCLGIGSGLAPHLLCKAGVSKEKATTGCSIAAPVIAFLAQYYSHHSGIIPCAVAAGIALITCRGTMYLVPVQNGVGKPVAVTVLTSKQKKTAQKKQT